MGEEQEILGNNRIEDVSWLCSLSESELDMLISLKMLVLQRAKVLGHEELADKFDLKMLRALALVLMECVKGKFENLSHDLGLSKSTAFVDGCNLLKCNFGDLLSIEEIKAFIHIDEKRKPAKRPREDTKIN